MLGAPWCRRNPHTTLNVHNLKIEMKLANMGCHGPFLFGQSHGHLLSKKLGRERERESGNTKEAAIDILDFSASFPFSMRLPR